MIITAIAHIVKIIFFTLAAIAGLALLLGLLFVVAIMVREAIRK